MVEVHVTLLPSFPHFAKFAHDPRLTGIRINSAMLTPDDVSRELTILRGVVPSVPCAYDVKGRQLRVAEVLDNPSYLDVRLNHPVTCTSSPTLVLLKAGGDAGMAVLSEDGTRLTFTANPKFSVKVGESVCVKDPGLVVGGPLFTHAEVEKVARVRGSGLVHEWYLSYVEEAEDVEAFRGLVGDEDQVYLKIESQRGLAFARYVWTPKKFPRTRLVAACGDLFVEVDQPHQTLEGIQSILRADPTAVMGSRMMLSVMRSPTAYLCNQVELAVEDDPALAAVLPLLRGSCEPAVPDLADFAHLAWMYDHGMRAALLCDEICLHPEHLEMAVGAVSAWAADYAPR